ncbi:MAG TPA: hypothetical protein VK988_17490 [Acidimicrobiales bacterium]|nr:hypothetical protein [Acidimicrobiales bacterium]
MPSHDRVHGEPTLAAQTVLEPGSSPMPTGGPAEFRFADAVQTVLERGLAGGRCGTRLVQLAKLTAR